MLMTIRAFNEAGRALIMWTALQSDVARRSDDAKARQAADDHMGLMTPVIKGVLTDLGFANTVTAQQVLGGHGYIRDSGIEQFVRDARIPMIYEGTNGIQALDLVGRKLGKDGGRAVMAFFAEVQGFRAAAADAAMSPWSSRSARRSATSSRRRCGSCRTPSASPTMPAPARPTTCISSGSSCSATCGAVSRRPPMRGSAQRPGGRMAAKLVTARFFMERMLPETATRLARIQAGAAAMMELPAEAF